MIVLPFFFSFFAAILLSFTTIKSESEVIYANVITNRVIHPSVHLIHASNHPVNRSSVHHIQASNHPVNRSSVHPANRVTHILFDQCEHDMKKLVHLTNPMKQPWFVELSGVIEKEMLTITVVMNVKMMKNSKRINHFDYSAFINGQWYSNRNHIHQAPEVLLQT